MRRAKTEREYVSKAHLPPVKEKQEVSDRDRNRIAMLLEREARKMEAFANSLPCAFVEPDPRIDILRNNVEEYRSLAGLFENGAKVEVTVLLPGMVQ